jgi:hypothetical protein
MEKEVAPHPVGTCRARCQPACTLRQKSESGFSCRPFYTTSLLLRTPSKKSRNKTSQPNSRSATPRGASLTGREQAWHSCSCQQAVLSCLRNSQTHMCWTPTGAQLTGN